MKTIGTVLPTEKSLRLSDRYARDVAAKQQAVGKRDLADCEKRSVGGEVRHYASADRYAVVGRDLGVRWFVVRADGDYRA